MLAGALATGACADAAGPGTRADARDLAGDLQAATAALETAPWQSYAATRLGQDAILPPPGASSGGITWTWDTGREGYQPSELPGGVPGTVRFVLYPLDSLGRRIEPPGNPVGYADVQARDRANHEFHVQVGGGPTRYADYVIRGADLSREGDAAGTFAGSDVEARLTMSYRESPPDAGRADFQLGVPARDLSLRVSSRYADGGAVTAFRASLQSGGQTMEATGSLDDGRALRMILLQDQRPVAVVELAGDSTVVTGSQRILSGSLAEAATSLGHLIRTVIQTRESLREPVVSFQH
ncbi:MAG: hypothetical protein ACREL6_12065 [Gemmatimonadales bacterium]